ncbi:HSP20-like chaperone [Zalerion maritima]|uniref:HSP20-like chaperone n=1 Tax=Zalerion maritima TaxID=339359 RepID=A0AAD5RWC0_9PEZI|nr:HSP20-like chaperone [Zalerion maritima]
MKVSWDAFKIYKRSNDRALLCTSIINYSVTQSSNTEPESYYLQARQTSETIMTGNFFHHDFSSPLVNTRQQKDTPTQSRSSEDSGRKHSGIDSLARLLHSFNMHHDNAAHGESKVHPLFDLVEGPNNFKIYGELPGMAKDNLHIDVNDHLFTIAVAGKFEVPGDLVSPEEATDAVPVKHRDAAGPGTKDKETDSQEAGTNAGLGSTAETAEASENKEAKVKYYIRERKLGDFKRGFQFPVEVVKMEDVTACYSNGLLTITVPKNAAPVKREGRKLEVE